MLATEWCCKASMKQRRGRTGRIDHVGQSINVAWTNLSIIYLLRRAERPNTDLQATIYITISTKVRIVLKTSWPNLKEKFFAVLNEVAKKYKIVIKDLLSIGLRLESLLREDFLTAMRIQSEYGLLTNDALFIAVAERLRISSVVSADKCFKNISNVQLFSPDDIAS